MVLAGCQLMGLETPPAESELAGVDPAVAETGGLSKATIPLPESESEPLIVLPAPPGPPPRKPLIGISLLPSKPDHEGFEALRSYEAVKLTEDNLIGIEEEDAMGLFGIPEQIREDPPAKVWSYDRDGCSLEIYFYLDLESNNLRSLTYELEAGEPSEAARQACLTRLLTPEGDHG